MSEPDRMRLQALVDWLVKEEGLTENNVRKLVREGVILGVTLPGDTRKYYLRSQVRRDVFGGKEG